MQTKSVRRRTLSRIFKALVVVNLVLVGLAVYGWAQEAQGGAAAGDTLSTGLRALGAGIAFLGGAIGTGMAQSRVIAAVLGAVAEDPGQLGFGIFLIAFPETLVILGFVMAFILR